MTAPLFILAPPRSFTSIVCGMVGQHPELYGLPEVNLFGGDTVRHLSRWYFVRPRFQHGLLRAIAELGLGSQTEEDVDAAKQWLREQANRSTGDVYKDLVEWAAPRRLVDKSPMYVYEPDAFERAKEAFPDARYLHLTRHPRSTCESLVKLMADIKDQGGRSGGFDANPDSVWRDPHVQIMEFLEGIPAQNHLRVKGEDLMADPRNYLRQICEWLEIRQDEEAIEAMMHPENSPYACEGPPNAKFGNDPSFMEKPALREYRVPDVSLEGPLDYDANLYFSDTLRHYANMFGYS